MIELIDIAKSFGSQKLFENVNLRIGPHDRIGLVGPNGTGKTTLFKIILGEISPDQGCVNIKKGLKIGYLPQEVYPSLAKDLSLLDFCVREVRGIGALIDARTECLNELEHNASEEAAHRLAEIEEKLHFADYEGLPKEAEEVLLGLGFKREDLARPLRTLSGGLLMRAELARLLLDRPDVLLLDEPTNQLDLEGLMWFEEYIQGFPGAIVMVAHDREFLNKTVEHIVEISQKGVVDYGGNPNLPVYDRYVIEREKAIELAWKRYEEQRAFIEEQERFIQANKVRKDRAGVVQARIRMLEKLERLEPPEAVRTVRFRFPQPPRSPDLVVELDRVTCRYGTRTVFQSLDLRLHRREKVALVGINGAGKSTLLRLIAGLKAPDEGTRRLAEGVCVGYFAQDQFEVLSPDKTVHQVMLEVADYDTAPHVRGVLGAFLFKDDDIDKKVAALSGGERARLMLARLLLQPFGLLVLDEPTNHLDIVSREVLENALKEHQGTVVFTSHDRRFMDTVATAIIELRDGRAARWEGNYSYYLTRRGVVERKEEVRTVETKKKLVRSQEMVRAIKREEAERRNRLYRLLKPLRDRVALFEAEIERIEAELREVESLLVSPDIYQDIERARAAGMHAKELRARLDRLYEDWALAIDELKAAEVREL